MKVLVLTPSALFRLSQFSISAEWFEIFDLPPEVEGLKRIVVDDLVYLIDSALTADTGPIVVINVTGEHAVFSSGKGNVPVLERIITVGRSVYTTGVIVPSTWRQYREDHVFSIAAGPASGDWRARIHFDTRPNRSADLFVFARTEDPIPFPKLPNLLALHAVARAKFPDAILTEVPNNTEYGRSGIVLSQRLPQGFVQGLTLEQRSKTKLTDDQLRFVDKPYDGPVRLRGSAGTGKTLSLVTKFLRDGIQFEHSSQVKKLGFLTHSLASVDLVEAISESLDTTGLIFGLGDYCRLEVRTLYDLAHEHLHFSLNDLAPLSLDGREGRRFQRELIESVLREMAKSSILKIQYGDLSSSVSSGWYSLVEGKGARFVAELMNEFASVLDAEGIRAGEERGDAYARGGSHRPAWLMPLPSEIDRRFVLDVHRRYRSLLGEMSTISVDQMVADFNSFLDSNRWDRVRSRLGYDALFVDELHLFTSVERQILHKLIKRAVDEGGRPMRPPIFMAYDLKQSPRDTFAAYGMGDNSLFTPTSGLQKADLVKLDKVFRYTPQIAEFLADLDATFPAIDIPGEWEAYAGDAKLHDGNAPELYVVKDEAALFRRVFDEASRSARTSAGGGRRVAVLCPSEERFDACLKAATGQFQGRFVPISSREPSSELRHAGKRFVFSMPEYVAGLQFETVYLIHVDAQEAPSGAHLGDRRRFISNVYLGSSRAEQTLKIFACTTRGGYSDILEMALQRRSLHQMPI